MANELNPNANSIIGVKEFFDRHNGLQRSNRFSVTFNNLPEGLPEVAPTDYKVESVAMAARAIDSVSDNLAGYGSGRAVPRSQRFIPGVLLRMPVTGDNFILDFFNSWFNIIYSGGRIKGDYNTPFVLKYYDDVVLNCSMDVKILDLNGKTTRKYTFYEVYPIECIPVELAMSEPNKFMSLQVLLNYRDFTFKAVQE
jgi:hypothetical protein